VKAWEIQRKKAEKRRREAERRERHKGLREKSFFTLRVGRDTGAEVRDIRLESVIVKRSDESVYDAGFEAVEPGMAILIEGPMGLIERAVVEEKIEPTEEGGDRILRVRAL
jgi:hypothetical protein